MPREKLLRKSPQKIGEILVQKGYISQEALEQALQIQKKTRVRRVGEILKDMGRVSEEQIGRSLADQYQLDYIDLSTLPPGWTIDAQLYSFKAKYLKILPLRDPEQNIWFILSDVTEDEKLQIDLPLTADLGTIRFAVAASTPQTQFLNEHPTEDEKETPGNDDMPIIPSQPAWLERMLDGGEPRPDEIPEAIQMLGLSRALLNEPLETQIQSLRQAVERAHTTTPERLCCVEPERLLEIIGILWARAPSEFQRVARLAIRRGPRFRLEFRQVVPVDRTTELPPGFVKQAPDLKGRNLEVNCTLPLVCRRSEKQSLSWPSPWPPPDLSDAITPLFSQLCHIPSHLKMQSDSLRWLGNDSPGRQVLNELTISMLGVSLKFAKIISIAELWDAIRARVRCLQSNQVVRNDWERWKAVQSQLLDIHPGTILAMCCLALGSEPAALSSSLRIERVQDPIFSIELYRQSDESGQQPVLRISTPSLA